MSTRRIIAALVTCVALVTSVGRSETITVDTGGDPEARLELRTVDVPGGGARSFYVIVASTVTITSEDWTIVGTRIEFDPDTGTIRIVGDGTIRRTDETLIGRDMVLQLESGRLDGDDVLVLTGQVDVFGADARRVDGRIRFLDGSFTTCGRCGQDTEDFAFSASRIELLPGDRLLAWDATLLIRDRPFFFLPLVVLPLAEPTRTPRLFVRRAGSDALAEIEIVWPYVTPPSGLGSLRVRALVDVDPNDAGPAGIAGGLLGGAPKRWVGTVAVDHRFVTPTGSGTAFVDVDPGADAREGPGVDPVGATDAGLDERPSRTSFGVTYQGDDVVNAPVVQFSILRDDDARRGLVEASASVSVERGAVTATVLSRTWFTVVSDGATAPSWGGASTFETVPLEASLGLGRGSTVRAAPLTVEEASVTLGGYLDDPDPSNRDVAGRDVQSDGRIEVLHRLRSQPVAIAGARVTASNRFRGRYYGSADRQVAWDTTILATRTLGSVARVEATLQRQANEGETPFLADRQTNVSRTDLVVRVVATPAEGVTATFDGGYVFVYDREPTDVGWTATRTALSLLGHVRWASVDLVHEARPNDLDWGELDVTARLITPFDPWVATASLVATVDLDVRRPFPDGFDDGSAPEEDASTRRYEASIGRTDVAVASVASTWTAAQVASDEGPWSPLEIAAEFGTMRPGDLVPGARIELRRDLATGDTLTASYVASASFGPLTVDVEQQWNEEGGRFGAHGLSLTWTDVARVDVEGVEVVPARWVGLAPEAGVTKPLVVTLEDARASTGRFRVIYRTSRVVADPVLGLDQGGEAPREFRNSALEVTATVAEARDSTGTFRASADAFVDYVLADDDRETGFLRRANVTVATTWSEWIALQGTFGYRGTWDDALDRVASGRLTFDEVALVVRPTPQLTVAAVLEDVWELFDAGAAFDAPIDPRPTVYVAWDRCCWATYARWDTRTGEFEVTLGTPGSAAGPRWTWQEGPTVPWTPPVLDPREDSP